MDLYNLINLVKTTTCFKGTGYWSFTDKPKYSFKNTNAFETGLSDHYLWIYSMLKTSFLEKWPEKADL